MTKTEVMARACQTLRCGDCGGSMHAVSGRYGEFFACTQYPICKGTVGAYPDGRPLGVPANAETRAARVSAHATFDRLWKERLMSRHEAYQWLRLTFKLAPGAAHIGQFDIAMCQQVEREVTRYIQARATSKS